MSLRRRLFLTLCLIVLLGFFSLARWVRGELRNNYAQVAEEILVDYAHLLSAHIENQKMSEQGFQSLREMFATYKQHKIDAKIFNFIKSNRALELYVTDDKGKVVFATDEKQVGQDYSQWNDVYKTLRGEYGARSTRSSPNDSRSSVYFVAAPIRNDSKIVGVVTIYKTESSILAFMDRALQKIFFGGLFSVIAIGAVGGLIMIWITLPLEKLRQYAIDISEGRRGILPKTNIREIKHLSEAFEKMRISLEGKKTVEKYTQTLTHELKSPLTAIKGAAELCLEEMDRNQQLKFLRNIIDESNRSHILLEQLLKVAALEAQHGIENPVPVDLVEIINEAKEALMGLWMPANIEISIKSQSHSFVDGDKLLLFQAFRNIIQNAIEFSNPKSEIIINIIETDFLIKVQITDTGVGIPEYAMNKIFEKFYSLERPHSQQKSSGLGLSFVKEVVSLHDGIIFVESPINDHRGTEVNVEFPKIEK